MSDKKFVGRFVGLGCRLLWRRGMQVTIHVAIHIVNEHSGAWMPLGIHFRDLYLFHGLL